MKKKWFIFITLLIIITALLYYYNKDLIWFLILFIISYLVRVFFKNNSDADRLLLILCFQIVIVIYVVCITIFFMSKRKGVFQLNSTDLFLWIFILSVILVFVSMFISNKHNVIPNNILQKLKDFSTVLTFALTIYLAAHAIETNIQNSQEKQLYDNLSKIELYFSSNEKIINDTDYSFSKDDTAEISSHIKNLNKYIIYIENIDKKAKKISFIEYLKINDIKISKPSSLSDDNNIARRVNLIETYLISPEQKNFISFSFEDLKDNKNSDSISNLFSKDFNLFFITLVIYTLTSYYLLTPLQQKDTQKETIHTSSNDNKNKREENKSLSHSISSVALATILFLFITNHDKKE